MRFPEFSGEWAKFRNDSLFNVISEKNKGKLITSVLSASQTDGMVSRDSLGIDIKFEEDSIKNYKIVREGDYVIHLRSFQGGFAFSDRIGVCSPAYTILRPRKQVSFGFLKPFFMSNKFINSLRLVTYGIRDGKSISVEEWLKLNTHLPSLKEQQKISSFLSLLDERIATQIKIIEKLESLIRGIVETHYSNCQHKTKVKIADLGMSFTTMNMSKEDLSNEGNECILYGELFTTYGCVISSIKSRTQLSIDTSTISQKNDLLFPASTTVDAMSLIAPSAICKDGVILGGDLFGIHISKDYDSEYLSYLINNIYKSHLARFAQGSTIIHLHYSDIKNAIIELPSLSEQKYLASLMREVESKIVNEKNMLSKLEVQKAYLLSHLFI